MAMSVNTNVVSLNAQRNLGSSGNALATAMQRLSSGLRLNSAKDDAAGLAISERMDTQIRGLNVAVRNANDGISLAQTAEGALGKVGDMLQRMRELAVQSSNATNSTTDRAALQAEVAQLKEEIGRVATTTKFNGTSLINGSFTAQAFQVGANSGETITLAAIANASLAALGTLTPPSSYINTRPAITAADGAIALSLSINGVTVGIGASTGRTEATARTELAAAFATAQTANPTALAGVALSTAGVITSTTSADTPLVIAALVGLGGVSAGSTNGTLTAATVQTGITNLNVLTAADSASAMDAIDTALTVVNTARGTLGAVQSRFENAISSIQVTAENLTAARGRIVDADFAMETANLSRAQILQQAGTAMVAQANQLPQQVLQLLR